MKNILKTSFILLTVFVFTSVLQAQTVTPLTLVSYDVSDTIISPNNDGIQDNIDIDIKYSEEVIADINILDEQGNKVKEIYHSDGVTNPQTKIWDGKDNSGQIVSDGIYTIQILGIATADETNTISDTSKTISVDTSVSSPTLSSIAITTPANKLNYTVGDTLDISGLVVTGTYSDASTKVETVTIVNISGFDSSAPATDQILTITVGGKTTSYIVDIVANDSISITANIALQDNCTVTAINEVTHIEVTHTFPEENSPSHYLAICAFKEALEQNLVSDIDFADFGFGLFINSVNNISENNTYWQLQLNNVSASVGVSQLAVKTGDVVSLILTAFDPTTFAETPLNKRMVLNITSLATGQPPGGGDGQNNQSTFDIQKALTYLKSVQNEDGSFGESNTDWVAIAFGALNVTDSSRDKLLAYLDSHNSINPVATEVAENERQAMAILALGKNPYSFNGLNYIDSIVSSFDGTQFGTPDYINDDIFALIPLANSGYTGNDTMIIKDITFLISKQKTNGSWVDSPDITAAAIQALKSFESVTGVTDTLSKATQYLASEQRNDGGWKSCVTCVDSSPMSTSWVMQAMSALDASWTKNGKSGLDYLTTQQAEDGGIILTPPLDTKAYRIWATSYAIPAALGKPWSEIMQSVSKPTNQTNNQSDSNNSSGSSPEIINPQTPPTPVVCPTGDLFSATTGQACTTFIARNSTPANSIVPLRQINSPQAQPITAKPAINSTLSTPKEVETQNAEKVEADMLTAAVTDALPVKDTPQTTPIVLGVLSGAVLLYAGFKFLIK